MFSMSKSLEDAGAGAGAGAGVGACATGEGACAVGEGWLARGLELAWAAAAGCGALDASNDRRDTFMTTLPLKRGTFADGSFKSSHTARRGAVGGVRAGSSQRPRAARRLT